MTSKNLPNVTFFTHKISPPCRMVNMTLKALDLDCKFYEVDFFGGEQATPEYLAVNPSGKIPALKDGDLCIGESEAIAAYLCNKYAPSSPLYPQDPAKRAKVDQLLYIGERLSEACYAYTKPFQVIALGEKPGLGDEKPLKKMLDVYEGYLSKSPFLTGDCLTLADISAINWLKIIDLCEHTIFDDFLKLKAWKAKMEKLPYYDECTGNPNNEIKTMYQNKLNA